MFGKSLKERWSIHEFRKFLSFHATKNLKITFQHFNYVQQLNINAHESLKTLELSIMKNGVNYLIDVDIKRYFDHVDR